MALAIASTPPAAHFQPRVAPPPPPTAPAAQPAAASEREQQAALNRLLNTYRTDQASGLPANTLTSLGRQITADAQAIGQHVTLPRAPAAANPPVTTGLNLTV